MEHKHRKASYKTGQGEGVQEYLKENAGRHVTVEEIRRNARTGEKPIGLATIYRQLDKMVEEGLVAKYVTGAGSPACYEYLYPDQQNTTPEEFHCKCINCGTLIHIQCQELFGIGEHLLQEHHFMMDPKRTVFYGLCQKCQIVP